jgi:hypothetical protein
MKTRRFEDNVGGLRIPFVTIILTQGKVGQKTHPGSRPALRSITRNKSPLWPATAESEPMPDATVRTA